MLGRSRSVLIYFVAVVLPAAVLLFISFRSVQRQRDAVAVLQKANRELNIERRASQLALEKRRLAETCLRDLRPDLIPGAILKWRSLHPIAKHFFSWKDGRLLFPKVEAEPKSPVRNPLLREGERLEFQENSLEPAIFHYRWARGQNPTAEEEALALAHEARCLGKLGRRAEAEAIWRRLADHYADVHDPYGRPYGLVAPWEANGDTSRIERACREFVNGRWLLSVDHAEYYRSRFQEASPGCLAGRNSEFLGLVQFAKALDHAAPQLAALNPADGNHFALARGAESYEIWYDAREETPGGTTLIGFAVDTDWVDRRLVPKLPAIPPAQAPIEGTRAFFWLTFGVGMTLLTGLLLVSRAAWRESQVGRGKAEFLAGISHDMKTPLTVIQQHTEELMEDSSLDGAGRMANYHVILGQIAKLLSSIDSALTLARQDSSRAGVEPVLQDPLPLLESVAEGFRKRLRGNEFSLVTEFAPDLPKVRVDAESIARSIWNLLDNAVKYSLPPATVRLRARTQGRSLAIEVEDQGVGIPARHRRRIFEPYFRLANGVQHHGLGLGLTVVKQVMRQHHGRVEVISLGRTGTMFRLLLPIANGKDSDR